MASKLHLSYGQKEVDMQGGRGKENLTQDW